MAINNDYLGEKYAVDQGPDYAKQDRVTVAPSSPIIRVAKTLKECDELCWRVVTLAERLVGATPAQSTGAKGISPTDGSVFSSLDSAASETRNALNEAIEALSRIERALP